jgi:hypothetical protein
MVSPHLPTQHQVPKEFFVDRGATGHPHVLCGRRTVDVFVAWEVGAVGARRRWLCIFSIGTLWLCQNSY